MATVFWGHKCVLRGYAVTAECCGKPGRLPETIPCQTPGLLRPDVILYDNKVVVFKCESDVMLYVVGPSDENEIFLFNVILALRDSLNILLK